MCQSFDGFLIFTACQRSCGKVMFSIARVCQQGGGYAMGGREVSKRDGGYARGLGIQEGEWVCWGLVSKREGVVYGWQAGGTHPTVMLSFQFYLFTSIHQQYLSSTVFLHIEQCILPNVQVYFKQSAYEDSKICTARSKTGSRGLLDKCISKLGRMGCDVRCGCDNENPHQ